MYTKSIKSFLSTISKAKGYNAHAFKTEVMDDGRQHLNIVGHSFAATVSFKGSTDFEPIDTLQDIASLKTALSMGEVLSVDPAGFACEGLSVPIVTYDGPIRAYDKALIHGDLYTLDMKAIKSASKCMAAPKDPRYYLRGVCLKKSDGDHVAIAVTNGHTCYTTADKGAEVIGILPAAAIEVLCCAAINPKVAAFVTVIPGDHLFELTFMLKTGETVQLVGDLVEGVFPNVDLVFPEVPSVALSVDRKDFTNSVKKVAKLLRASGVKKGKPSSTIVLEYDMAGTLTTKQMSGACSASDSVRAKGPTQNVFIGLEPDYLLAALAAIDAGTITLSIPDENSVMLVTNYDCSERYAIMPKRL